jgi:iron complex outermembrane recepter protein
VGGYRSRLISLATQPEARASCTRRWGAFAATLAIACSASSYGADADGPPAPNSPNDQTVEEVVVTGSRIQRRDYEANSPILTIDDSLLKNSSTTAVETALTKLPQFHPVQTPAQGGDMVRRRLTARTPWAA